MIKRSKFFTFVFASVLFSSPLSAVVTILLTEVGDDVVATASSNSDFDSDGLSKDGNGLLTFGLINPAEGLLYLAGPSDQGGASINTGLNATVASFGTGGELQASSGSGTRLGMTTDNIRWVGNPKSVAATSVWSNQSFASMGITEGVYTWSWANDSIVLNATLSAVPEPSTGAAIIGGLVLLHAVSRRRR